MLMSRKRSSPRRSRITIRGYNKGHPRRVPATDRHHPITVVTTAVTMARIILTRIPTSTARAFTSLTAEVFTVEVSAASVLMPEAIIVRGIARHRPRSL